MEPVSHTTTTVITDKRVFKTTAPSGDVYYMTLLTESRERTVETPIRPRDLGELPRRRVKTTMRATTRRQVHRVAPYPGARPVRVSASEDTRTVRREGIVMQDTE